MKPGSQSVAASKAPNKGLPETSSIMATTADISSARPVQDPISRELSDQPAKVLLAVLHAAPLELRLSKSHENGAVGPLTWSHHRLCPDTHAGAQEQQLLQCAARQCGKQGHGGDFEVGPTRDLSRVQELGDVRPDDDRVIVTQRQRVRL